MAWQAITRTEADSVHWRTYAALEGDKLTTRTFVIKNILFSDNLHLSVRLIVGAS